jgi:hypothetical protein
MAGITRHGLRLVQALLCACTVVACASKDPDTGRAPLPVKAEPDAALPGVTWGHAPSEYDAGSSPVLPADAGARAPAAEPSPDGGDAGATPEKDAGPQAFACHGPGARFATHVVSHWFGPGQSTGQSQFPAPLLGPPKGGGADQGSTDVVSLGNGGWVVLEFAGNEIVDGPGPDFIVFENPFQIQGDPSNVFAELGTVAVSEDGVTWASFPCTAQQPPYGECSGWHVVYANADTNRIDPTDPAVAGGDAYDLAELGLGRARYVRVTDRADLGGMNGVYDLDAVSIVHPLCP